jgi:hypothetical protein
LKIAGLIVRVRRPPADDLFTQPATLEVWVDGTVDTLDGTVDLAANFAVLNPAEDATHDLFTDLSDPMNAGSFVGV